jgi:2'-5' RNA ligase
MLLEDRFREAKIPIQWLPLTCFHVTLKYLGEVEVPVLDIVEEELSKICEKLDPFPVKLSKLSYQQGSNASGYLWIGVEAEANLLNSLIELMNITLESIGFSKSNMEVLPHVTLGIVPDGNAPELIESTICSIQPPDISASLVREITLFNMDWIDPAKSFQIFSRLSLRDRHHEFAKWSIESRRKEYYVHERRPTTSILMSSRGVKHEPAKKEVEKLHLTPRETLSPPDTSTLPETLPTENEEIPDDFPETGKSDEIDEEHQGSPESEPQSGKTDIRPFRKKHTFNHKRQSVDKKKITPDDEKQPV